jgi:hypothetical protein
MKRMRFPASPADYRRAVGAEMGRPSDYRKSGRCIGGLDAPVWPASPASLSAAAPSPPEWPRGARPRGGHGGPHGARPRVPGGAREVSSVGARATAHQRALQLGTPRGLRRKALLSKRASVEVRALSDGSYVGPGVSPVARKSRCTGTLGPKVDQAFASRLEHQCIRVDCLPSSSTAKRIS